MRLGPFVAAFASITWLFAASAAVACSCVLYGSAAEQVADADLIFKGRVLDETRPGVGMTSTRFQTLEVLKGRAGRIVRISHPVDGAGCGVRFRRGATVLVFADRGRDGAWRTGLCSEARFSETDYRRAAALPIPAKNTVNVPVAPLAGMPPAAAVDPMRGSITFRRLLSESEARRVLGAAGARPYVVFMSVDSLQGSHRVPEGQSSLDILADARRQLAAQVGGTGARGATASRARALVERSTAEQLARNPRELSLARALLASAERDEKAATFAQADGPFIYGVEFLGGSEVQRRLRLTPEVHGVQLGFIVRGRGVAPDPENLAYRPPGSADSPVARLSAAEVYAKLRALAHFSDAEYRSAVRTQPPPASGRNGAVASRSFRVVQINGRITPPPVGRGNRYEVYIHRTGLSASLGCRTVAVPGAIVDGLFRPSAPQHGGLFTGGAPCGIPADQQWEPKLERALLSGQVRISEHENALTIQASDIIVRAVR